VWAFLSLLAIVNLFIGIVNWVPLLPFDGGHMAIAAYEGIRSRGRATPYRADVGRLLPLTYAVVLLLGLLFVGNTYLDLTHGIGG
jgi:membrane-associated protease RseP (regulator of RpoE activity)